MGKSKKIIFWSIFGVVAVLIVSLFIMLCLGFHFTPEAAVHEIFRNNTQIRTDEYIFFLHDITDEAGGIYADGHTVIKKYGFLYKEIEASDYNPLVAENGDRVGVLHSYEGKSKTYHFIHWSGYNYSDESLTELASDDDLSVSVVYRKYSSDNIVCNGKSIELFGHCYFETDEPIETLVIKDANVYVLNGIAQGNYWKDDKVIVINDENDIVAEQIKAHYDNNGVIVVRDWKLVNDVETIVSGVESTERDEKDLATVFCKTKSNTTYTGVVQGNTSDLESEVDEMVSNAKATQ
jgi:hypothetical protein